MGGEALGSNMFNKVGRNRSAQARGLLALGFVPAPGVHCTFPSHLFSSSAYSFIPLQQVVPEMSVAPAHESV